MKILIILLLLSTRLSAQSDSLLRNEPIPDTVWVTKIFTEEGKTIRPGYVVKWKGHWYTQGRRVNIILYKLRDGISDEWYHWPD